MTVENLVGQARQRPDCVVSPPTGQPKLPRGHALPADLERFYELCGGLRIESEIPIAVVAPERFLPANVVIRGEPGADDISAWWYIIAESGEGSAEERVSIDLGPGREGRCYDSFWDRHAIAGSSFIVALSFSELLERLLEEVDQPYWLADDFEPLGDAYDDGP